MLHGAPSGGQFFRPPYAIFAGVPRGRRDLHSVPQVRARRGGAYRTTLCVPECPIMDMILGPETPAWTRRETMVCRRA